MRLALLAAVSLATLTACATATPEPATQPQQAAVAMPNGLPPIIPLTHFFDNPEIAGAQISPDGQWLSYLKPYEGKLNVHIRPIEGAATAERRMTSDTVRPVTGYFWSADSRHLLYVQDKGGNENYHVHRVPVAGSGVPAATDLTPFEGVRAVIFDVPRDLPDRILIGLNKRNPSVFDVYWLNVATGDTTMISRNPGRMLGVYLDNSNQLRAGSGSNETGGTVVYARVPGKDEWREVASYPASENVTPLRVHPDGRHLYMISNAGDADLAGLVLLDLESGKTTLIERDPENKVDFGGAVFSDITDSLLATSYIADTVRIYPKTAEFARIIDDIRKLHRGTPNVTSVTRDERKLIVAFNAPTDPGATYLYDRATGEAKFLFRPRPWLKPEQLAPMRPVSYRATDGLTIHGYLTTPVGVAARNLPMVLVVHGGPWARDTWGYDSEAQLLANRGYAVLQINYRGSTGYGKAFYNAAVKEWAGKMHSDLIDGVRWAVRQGIADSSRVAIYGGSYGGYATLVGLTFTPETFACGVDYVGPSSLITLIESFPAYWKPFLEGSFYRHIGNPAVEADREDLRKRSPLFFVDRIEDPLLIVQGANDPRVTKLEADQIAIALRDRGVKVQYINAPNEGHGFANPDNRLALYRAMELFFKDCLSGRAQERVAPEITQHLAKLTVDVDTLTLVPKVTAVLIGVGDRAVVGTRITPDTSTYRLFLSQQGQEREIGTLRQEIAVIREKGQPALRRVNAINSPMMGTRTDTVIMHRTTLAPISHRSSDMRRAIALDFRGDSIRGSMTPAGGAAQPIAYRSEPALFDAAASDLVLRALPLTEGYAVELPVYLHEGGGKNTMAARVVGSETVTGPDGRVTEAWKVEGKLAGQTVTSWFAKESRDILKTEIQLAPGVVMKMIP